MRSVRSVMRVVAEAFARQQPSLFLWFPVMIGAGVGLYFALPIEPPLWPGFVVMALLAVVMASVRRHRGLVEIGFLLFLIVMGFVAGQMRTAMVYTPILEKKIGPVEVAGTIEIIEQMEGEKGQRILLRDLTIEKFSPQQTPVKVRLTWRKAEGLALGQRITVLAGLNPPSAPVVPGGFDFQRYMFFQQIGAVGFVYKMIEAGSVPRTDYWDWLEGLRNHIASRVRVVVSPEIAPMAIAFVNGQRSGIAKTDNVAMQDSGLAHLISISGLHVGLFSAFVFFVSRLLMALIPGWALKRPIKKYAAVLGFLSAAFYTLLAGSSIPTIRTLIMIGLAYLAILLDRSPLSLRLIAFAAVLVLLGAPETLVSASFQMSFGAVVALIVVFEALRPWLSEWHAQAGWVRRAGLYLAGVCLTTVIATLATAPFSVFHFQRLTVYGVLANMLAVPLTSFVIMPSIVMTLFLIPLGLEYPALKVLEFGMAGVLKIADYVAHLPGAVVHVAAVPLIVLVLFVVGVIFSILWRGPARWAGIIPLIVCVVVAMFYKQPDILVSREFSLMGYRSGDGQLHISGRKSDRFSIENWERMMGLPERAALSWPREGREADITCDHAACRLELKGRRISFLKTVEALSVECAWADVVITRNVVDENVAQNICPRTQVLDKFDGLRGGAHAIWLEPQGERIQTAEQGRGVRPWSGLNKTFRPWFSDSFASGRQGGPEF